MRRLLFAGSAAALVVLALGGAEGSARACTEAGGPAADVLRGTPGHDVICGRGGADTLLGLGGADALRGGPGSDRLSAGAGDDLVLGNSGDDRLNGGSGNDRLEGGEGTDSCEGGGGGDSFDSRCERFSNCLGTSTGRTPLTELGDELYKGLAGGLYGRGSNRRPLAHEGAGVELSESIGPLSPIGAPSPAGRYALVSIGPSLAKYEFADFSRLAAATPGIDPRLAIVNGAQDHVTASDWADPSHQAWDVLSQRLLTAGLSRDQVAVAWVKLVNVYPALWPEHAQTLSAEIGKTLRILADRFPNLRVAYLSSRVYAGYSTYGLAPEPAAYESGFAVRSVIRGQIAGRPGLNFAPAMGQVEVPWISWGPYLWADGLSARRDGLLWRCSDFARDGIHPSRSGARKVAEALLELFSTDPTATPWFLAD